MELLGRWNSWAGRGGLLPTVAFAVHRSPAGISCLFHRGRANREGWLVKRSASTDRGGFPKITLPAEAEPKKSIELLPNDQHFPAAETVNGER